jgi:hypothetical protein
LEYGPASFGGCFACGDANKLVDSFGMKMRMFAWQKTQF